MDDLPDQSGLERLQVNDLWLDENNPRLAGGDSSQEWTQERLIVELAKESNLYQVATSIAEHGFFESEPLIAVVEEEKYVVVEGNRRLAALKILSDRSLVAALPRGSGNWAVLSAERLPARVPVVVIENRSSVIPLLGYRHISGIEPWEPIAQARYIASLVEDEDLSLEEISRLVGRPLGEVRSMYRNHEILRQSSEVFKLDVQRAEKNFGVFTQAMGVVKLRSYIDAPEPGRVSTEYWPLPATAKQSASRLLTYLYGDVHGKGKVIRESRQIRELAEVLAEESGHAERVLRATGSLDDALEVVRNPDEKFISHLNAAKRALRQAEQVAPGTFDSSALARIAEIQASVSRLLGDSPTKVKR